MTYTPDIPKSGESLGGTRVRINANFQDINTFSALNHYGLTAPSNIGMHSRLDMPIQSTFPATPANQGWVQVQDTLMATFGGGTNTAELAWRGEGLAAGAGSDIFFLTGMPIRAAFVIVTDGLTGVETPVGRCFNINTINASKTGATTTYTIDFINAILPPAANYIVIPFFSVPSGSADLVSPPKIITKATAQLVMQVTFSSAFPPATSTFQVLVLGG